MLECNLTQRENLAARVQFATSLATQRMVKVLTCTMRRTIGFELEGNITFLCSRHIRPTCTKRSRCVCILRYGDGNCSNTKQNQQYINYVLKYDVSILLLSVPPVTREWKDACMAKSPGQAQRENATRGMYNITKLLQVRGSEGTTNKIGTQYTSILFQWFWLVSHP